MDEHKVRVNPNGRITIPAEIRRTLGIRPGDEIEWIIEGDHALFGPCDAGTTDPQTREAPSS